MLKTVNEAVSKVLEMADNELGSAWMDSVIALLNTSRHEAGGAEKNR
jgi:hypothetical protein